VPRSADRLLPLLAVAVLGAAAACAPRITEPPPAVPGTLPRAEPAIRVGIAVDTAAVELGSTAGLTLLDAGAGDRVVGRKPAGQAWRVTASADGTLLVARADGAAVGDARGPLVVRPDGGMLRLGGRDFRGSALVRSAGNGRVTAINVVEMEAYLLGVVPHEIGRVGEDLLEAAKAQAVAARTYTVAHFGRRESLGFDVFATVQDQVYGGAGSEHDVTTRAVRETHGIVSLYAGQPIEAYYHSTCAGRTAAIDEVWPSGPRPYLVSVIDVDPSGRSYDHFSNRYRWTQRWTASEINGILRTTLADSLPAGVSSVGELRDVRILERTASGRVARMAIETTTATFHIGRDRLRWILRTPGGAILNSSLLHQAELTRDANGRVTELAIHGGGWGHGIGMCQVGAMGRARAGQDYRAILTTYYPGTELRRLY
jgi:stage II sporulation protein D